MKKKDFFDSIGKGCQFLEEGGFKLRETDRHVDRNFMYEKTDDEEGFCIKFNWTQYGDNFHVKGLHALKRFNDVERPLQAVIGGQLSDYYTIHKMPSTYYIPKGLPYETTQNNIHFVIKEEADIKLYMEFLKSFYLTDSIPFFNRYEKFETV
jgi:hypothetical protein